MDIDLNELQKKEQFLKTLDIFKIQRVCETMPQGECPLEHEFADGIYSRKMTVPANALVIGKIHRFSTYNILLKGSCSIYAGENLPVKKIKAPFTFTSEPGTKKIAYFHEDSIWINVLPTTETDIDKIEEHFIIPEEEFFLGVQEALCLS
jgi:hypothetical protein